MSTSEVHINERMVGYDAREHWLTMDQGWTEQRKQSFLYRLDVFKPLSVDSRVWPTIFESEQRPAPVGFEGLQDCWSDFFELQRTVTRVFQEKPMRAWRMIAVTLLLDRDNREEHDLWSSRLPPANPDERGADWVFLGYDVADQWLLSALMNCGFRAGLDDVPALRTEWGPRLNNFHLFQDVADAFLFKRFSDERLRDDHAPCFVFGLWIVK